MADAGGLTPYEMERARRVAENAAKMRSMLGIQQKGRQEGAAATPAGVDASAFAEYITGGTAQKHRGRKRGAAPQKDAATPSRSSGRLRGEPATPQTPKSPATPMSEPPPAADDANAKRRHRSLNDLLGEHANATVVAPFTCRNSGVTVWNLGEIHRGDFQHRYWSSSGCLYHHAYPVGYAATKAEWNRTFLCTIAKGEFGPVFTVSEVADADLARLASGGAEGSSAVAYRASYAGATPTKPWTSACVARNTGRRISGPLYFGFSDPVTMLAIYALYNDAERAAALAGGRAAAAEPSALEKTTRELSERLPGIGESVAIALATTKAFGQPIRGADDLKRLAADDEARLVKWLTTSEEVPETTRRWPKWRGVHVPRLLRCLKGEDPEPAEPKRHKARRASM